MDAGHRRQSNDGPASEPPNGRCLSAGWNSPSHPAASQDGICGLLRFLVRGLPPGGAKNTEAQRFGGTEGTRFHRRGTDDKLDWLFNLNLGTKTCAQGVFHLGFVNAYNAVRSDARSYISQQSGQRIWVTGHSLGGAMALLCGFDQKLHGDVSADVVTFGQPRIADTKGCQSIDAALKDRYVRVARPTDVVPRVPPAFFTAYGHAGMHILLGNKGLTIGPSMTKTATQTAVKADRFGNICTVESVSTVHGSAFDEPPITLEELRSLPGHADHPVTDGQPVSFSPGAVAWAAFKYAIGKAIDWIVEQHSMDEYLRLARSYRGR